MDNEVIELLNSILKTAYEFGWEVGASWDLNHYKDLVNPSGYLYDDAKIDKELKENITKLLAKLGYNAENFYIYTKEDTGYHSADWEYIAPVLESKEKKECQEN